MELPLTPTGTKEEICAFYIAFFNQIPEEKWLNRLAYGQEIKMELGCAYNHCWYGEVAMHPLSTVLEGETGSINDGLNIFYPQKTPKQRILAALKDAAGDRVKIPRHAD